MKTAKEMFEELGFVGSSNKDSAYYSKVDPMPMCAKKITKVFRFDSMVRKVISYNCFQKGKNYYDVEHQPSEISPKEFLAIHQQMKELGWIE